MPPDCDLPRWLDLIEQFAHSGMRLLVPGHGPVGTAADLRRQKQYMLALRDMVAQAVRDGAARDEVLRLPFPPAPEEWDVYSRRHENNLRSLWSQMTQTGG